jgi:hypothetical protein
MILFRGKNLRTSERGVALVVALLMLMLISAALMGMIMMSNTETNISANFRDEQTAFFSSKAGIEEMRDRMRTGATDSLIITNTLFTIAPPPLPGAAKGILYVTNAAAGETVTPWVTTGSPSTYPDTEICKELPPCGADLVAGTWTTQTASNSYAASPKLPWKWVRVMAKANKSATGTTRVTSVDGTTSGNRVCWAGTSEIATAAASCGAANSSYLPVYEVTALAVTSSGSRRMTQYEVSQTPFPPMPGAMIFDGPNPDYGTNPNSAAFAVSGTDAAHGPTGTGCPAANSVPGIAGYNAASTTSLGTQVNRPGSYTGSPAGVADESSNLGPLSTVDGLTNLANSITTAAGPNVYGLSPLPNPSTLNLGTDAAPVINVVQGDYTFGGSGAGILLVTGTLTFNGSPSYNGIILVIGQGNVQKNGGGNGTLNGSLFVANLYSDTPPTYTHPIPLGANSPPGIPTIAWNGGGNATIQYDSCWINAVNQSFPYRIVAQRELIY